jgi:dTDP-4-dehydrorhamnose reductase
VRILITGAQGQLGTDLVRLATEEKHVETIGAGRELVDVGERDSVLSAITSLSPDIVIHAGAWTAVDACESDTDRAWRVNALGCRHVSEGARLVGAHLVVMSTDYVFDGESGVAYTEWDRPNPLSAYGRSKLGGEDEVRSALPGATIVRTSWLCGQHGRNIVKTILDLAAAGGGPLRFVDDQTGSPTFTADLAGMILQLAVARRPGLFHVTNQGSATWFQLAREVLAAAGLDPSMVEPVTTAALDPPRAARRPAYSVLDNAALRLEAIPCLPDYHEPLERTVKMLVASPR